MVCIIIQYLTTFCPVLLTSNIQPDSLPEAITGYFTAVAGDDREMFSELFTDDAEILEVDRIIYGKKAILSWANNEVYGGKYVILRVLFASDTMVELLVEFTPRGNSASFRANYKFNLTDRKISSMNLQYAD